MASDKHPSKSSAKAADAALIEWGRVTGDIMATHHVGQQEADALLTDAIRGAEAQAADGTGQTS